MIESPARLTVALLAGVVALSLVAAPVTMAAWSHSASFSVDRIQPSNAGDQVPIVHYENLSESGQRAVQAAITSPDGHHFVYGRGDWPPDFAYTDYSAPGRGLYIVEHGGSYYRLYTAASGGFPFVYWLLELPFVAYGLVLVAATRGARDDARRVRTVGAAAVVGLAFHALGPAFDFPLVGPHAFAEFEVVGVVALVAALLWERRASA